MKTNHQRGEGLRRMRHRHAVDNRPWKVPSWRRFRSRERVGMRRLWWLLRCGEDADEVWLPRRRWEGDDVWSYD